MSEINLLSFGCVVSFISIAGFYVYLRECWTAEEQPSKPVVRSGKVEEDEVKGVA